MAEEVKFHTVSDRAFRAMNQAAIDTQALLEATEKSLDRALQENLKLQEQVARLTRDAETDEEIINALDEMVEQPPTDVWDNTDAKLVKQLNGELEKANDMIVLLMGQREWGAATGALLEDPAVKRAYDDVHRRKPVSGPPAPAREEMIEAEATVRPALKATEEAAQRIVQSMNAAEVQIDKDILASFAQDKTIKRLDDEIIIDDPFDEVFGTAAHAAKAGEPISVIINDPLRPDRVIKRLDDELQVAEVKVALAQGDRAKIQQTLTQTQKACRRYKARISRQNEQLDALKKLAEAAFPLYEKLVSAMGSETVIKTEHAKLTYFSQSRETEQQCVAFHNAFNEAAEALTPPRRGDTE